MANRIVTVHAGICGMGIYAIMLPSSGFSVAHYINITHLTLMRAYNDLEQRTSHNKSDCYVLI